MSRDDLASSLGYTVKSLRYDNVYQIPNTNTYIKIDNDNKVVDLIKE